MRDTKYVPSRSMPQSQAGLALVTVLLIVALISTLQVFMIEQQHLLIRRIGNQIAAEKSYQYAQGVNAWAARVLHDDLDRQSDYLNEDWAKFGQPPELGDGSGEQEYDDFGGGNDDSSDSGDGLRGGDRRSGSDDSQFGRGGGQERGDFNLKTTRQQQEEKKKQVVIDFDFDGLQYEIVDLQSRFNLNNLAVIDPAQLDIQKTIFLNLLEILEIGQLEDRQSLYDSLVDWIDENDLQRGSGFESTDYSIKKTPYFAADQMITSVGELRFVEGFTEEIISQLKPYVTALPVSNATINLNTASVEVVAALSAAPVTDLNSVQAFLAEREDKSFRGFQSGDINRAGTAIIGSSVVRRTPAISMLGVSSQFFAINTHITLGDYEYCMRSSVLRQQSGGDDSGAPGISVLHREHDSFCLDQQPQLPEQDEEELL